MEESKGALADSVGVEDSSSNTGIAGSSGSLIARLTKLGVAGEALKLVGGGLNNGVVSGLALAQSGH